MDMQHVVTLQVERDLERLSDRLEQYVEDGSTFLATRVDTLDSDLDDFRSEVDELEERIVELEKRLTRVVKIVMEILANE